MRRGTGICYLYSIVRNATGQRYIGLTVNPKLRWWTHRWSAGRSPQFIHRAIAKYGQHEFSFQILACSRQWTDAVVAEQQLISQYNCHASSRGYNLTLGGEGPLGRICSPETRAKIGSANKGRVGPVVPESQREIHRSHTLAMYAEHPEYRLELARRAMESRKKNGNMGYGRKNSAETISKMREAALGRWANTGRDDRRRHMQAAIDAGGIRPRDPTTGQFKGGKAL